MSCVCRNIYLYLYQNWSNGIQLQRYSSVSHKKWEFFGLVSVCELFVYIETKVWTQLLPMKIVLLCVVDFFAKFSNGGERNDNFSCVPNPNDLVGCQSNCYYDITYKYFIHISNLPMTYNRVRTVSLDIITKNRFAHTNSNNTHEHI